MPLTTENHLIDRKNNLYLNWVDLFEDSEQIGRFEVMRYDRIVECNFNQENNPIFILSKLVDDVRHHIMKDGISNVGKLWCDEEIEGCYQLFVSEDSDLVKISEKMEWSYRGIRITLRSMVLVDEKDQKCRY